jgi:hypothetical protein
MQIFKLSPVFLSQAETEAEVQNGHRHKQSHTQYTTHTRVIPSGTHRMGFYEFI